MNDRLQLLKNLRTLTKTEWRMAWFMAQGIRDEERLNRVLKNEPKTRETHITSVYRKLGFEGLPTKGKEEGIKYLYRTLILELIPTEEALETVPPPLTFEEVIGKSPEKAPESPPDRFLGTRKPKEGLAPVPRPERVKGLEGRILLIILVVAGGAAIFNLAIGGGGRRPTQTYAIPTPSDFTEDLISLERPGGYSVDIHFLEGEQQDNWFPLQVKFLVRYLEFRHIITIDYNRHMVVSDDLGNRYSVFNGGSSAVDTETVGEYFHNLKITGEPPREAEYLFIDIEEIVVQQYVPSLHSDVFYIIPPDVRMKINNN